MTEKRRKSLPHHPPWSVPDREMFFLTICAQDRKNQPLLPVAAQLLEAIRFYHEGGKWWIHLAVVMPDHLHLLASFPPDEVFVETVRSWKRWTARQYDIIWQRDFFDHRIRKEESFAEKADYVLQNPVRAGLVNDWQQWPHTWVSA